MHHPLGFFGLVHLSDEGFIADVALIETQSLWTPALLQPLQVASLESGVVVVVDLVNDDNVISSQ
jgi:hypothetical protein